jgi:hypothetical protein
MNEKNLYLVKVWVPKEKMLEIKAIAASMWQDWQEELKPTQAQIDLAQSLCHTKKGLKLSQNILARSDELAQWIKEAQMDEKGTHS